MGRVLWALCCAWLFASIAAPGPAVAKDTLLSVELDGRPLDQNGPSAILHRGRAFVDVVRIVKGFDGLLTFGKADRSVRVTIQTQTAQFFIGRRAGLLNGQPATFAGAPFILNGDTYVPLDTIATLSHATLSVDVRKHVALLRSVVPPPS